MGKKKLGYEIFRQIFRFSVFSALLLLSENVWATDLRYRLAMLGYNDQEITNIVYRKQAFSAINSNYKRAMLGYQTATSSAALSSRKRDKKPYGMDTSTKPASHEIRPVGRQGLSPELKINLLEEARPYLTIIKNAASKNDIVNSLILAIIKVESGFDTKALSRKGAMGLMQLMPDTASEIGVTNPFDPEQNIFGGTKYLSDCVKTFKDLELALAAYNAGPGKVARLQKVPMIKETQKYVKDILYYKKLYDQLLVQEARNM